ncbi:MAG: alpha/beta fold hydrolase [Mariprofundaceae bacterium]|nr:alpha/beta fold hydrolase [Mariprofundaceae bacterium]
MLECIEKETGSKPSIAIIWMHGLGANSSDFADLDQMLSLPTHVHYRFLLPQAPMLPISINNGYVMPAWYDIDDQDFRAREDEQGMQASSQAICDLMQREKERGVSHVILGGFSQGGAVALYTSLRETPLAVAAVVSLSAYLPFSDQLKTAKEQPTAPIFMAHGTEDGVVPMAWATQSCQLLREADYQVSWQSYPMQHHICDAEIASLSKFLSKEIENIVVLT